jgi:competence protein ComEC
MLPRPAWLALGVVVAAGSASYEPMAGDSAAAVVAAMVASGALVVVSWVARANGRRGLSSSLMAASLGAALVAARLAIGLVVGGGAAPPESTSLPPGSGPWLATVESAHEAGGQQIATITLEHPPVRCSADLPTYPRLIAGEGVSWTGSVQALTDSDYDRFLAAQGIAATCRVSSVTVVREDDSPLGRLEAFRQASGDALARVLPEPEGGLAAAILIGLRDRVDRDLAAAFTTSGVSHIVAISGWNIAIVAATVAALLKSRSGRRTRAMATLVAIVGYTLFAGASASVLRAAVMAGVAIAAVESGRGSRVTIGLAWAAAIMLLVQPATVADVGFQLSAVSTAGLVAWATPLSGWLAARAPWLPPPLVESLGVSLAAQAATLPIALLTFGRLALIAPAANLVAVPLVPPVMAAGAVAFGAGWLAALGAPAPIASLLAMPAAILLSLLVAVVRLAAAVPGANETLPFPANAAAAGVAAGLLVGMHRSFGRRRKRAARRGTEKAAPSHQPRARTRPRYRWALAGGALLLVLAGSVVAARPDGSFHVVVLDVGQGDAILLEGDQGGRILIDGGPDPTVLMGDLDRYIPTWDRRLDAIVLTHPHDDHVAGLVAVVERYSVRQAFESGWSVDTPANRAFEGALSTRGIQPERLSTGQKLQLDSATLSVLWPDDGTARPSFLDPSATDNRKTNDASVVMLGDYEGRRFLLTGDAEDDIDPILLSRGLPTVDVLKVAHHGSATASSDVLLATLRPAVVAVSVGANNPYGHPNGATMARLRNHSSAVFRTDSDGTIDTKLDRAAVTVTTARGGSASAAVPAASLLAGSAVVLTGSISTAAVRSTAVSSPDARARRSGLLYDPLYVRPEPPPEHGDPLVARTRAVAPSPLPGGRGDRRLAGPSGEPRRSFSRSPPRRGGRASA